ncbi:MULTISPECIES: TrmB family transcriptional regulator [Methanothrix]|jgi:sugar-specific transcriptional regulator TrmB|uniref:Transcriptional regulator, TrmB n=1 Tax=Methanothrix thermoacetophila (strain DSM 6194 / JCM 14653 / NBRC 101360 / PT) TaxID=349307 RepID=A0B9S5_METTP|nr:MULTISPECIES: helix-turn-helix domain-containing protein [Methanothrix]ABK15449.1 transcriptional regulator, TrmB [Methanothrix thermoacetophila PT]NPU88222.1 TrmB family transcriptional regulator [Methanothrix sp.]
MRDIHRMSEKNAIKALRDLGLTEYEARVYTALTRLKAGIASEIHQISGIPRPAVYGALKRLVMRGIVEVQPSKPMRYRVTDPAAALERLKSSFMTDAEVALHALEEVYSAEGDRREEEMGIWVHQGAGRVYEKVMEVLSGAERDILIINPSLLENLRGLYNIFSHVNNAIRSALDRGVSIRSVSPEDTPSWDIPGIERRIYPWSEKGICALIPDKGYVLLVVSGEQAVMAITTGDALSRVYRDLGEALWRASVNTATDAPRMDQNTDGFKSKY